MVLIFIFLRFSNIKHLFMYLLVILWFQIQKLIGKTMSWSLPNYISTRKFMVLGHTFKSLIHFELIFVYGIRQWSNFNFCMWLSSFLSTTYWRVWHFHVVYSQIFLRHSVIFSNMATTEYCNPFLDLNGPRRQNKVQA